MLNVIQYRLIGSKTVRVKFTKLLVVKKITNCVVIKLDQAHIIYLLNRLQKALLGSTLSGPDERIADHLSLGILVTI
jgi:hypothetical protein